MSENKHGEPWKRIKKSVVQHDAKIGTTAPNAYQGAICNCLGGGYGVSVNDEINIRARNNADRIVACVNACAGVETVGGLGSVKRLVEACNALVNPEPMVTYDGVRVMAWIKSALAEFEKAGERAGDKEGFDCVSWSETSGCMRGESCSQTPSQRECFHYKGRKSEKAGGE